MVLLADQASDLQALQQPVKVQQLPEQVRDPRTRSACLPACMPACMHGVRMVWLSSFPR